MRSFHLLAGLPLVALAAVVGLTTPTVAAAADRSSITLHTPSSACLGQYITVSGELTVNGRPAPAGVPVVIHIRPSGGPDVNVGTAFTDGRGRYSACVRVPNRRTPNIQISATSGGGTVPSARVGKVIPID